MEKWNEMRAGKSHLSNEWHEMDASEPKLSDKWDEQHPSKARMSEKWVEMNPGKSELSDRFHDMTQEGRAGKFEGMTRGGERTQGFIKQDNGKSDGGTVERFRTTSAPDHNGVG